ncbi:MAG TPA: DUF3786 domain-containing protein [Dissulfurispiraceae bacterium]|nr:DUF3786 domain-containing protein [Dissulfurispiraceae bacterium]
MNPVEIYKKLPRTNCGSCRPKLCMPFAFALVKGESVLSECPGLSPHLREELGAAIKKFDWREDLIAKLKADINKPLLLNASNNLGGEFGNDKLHIKCYGKDIVVDSSGDVESDHNLTSWMNMLVLFYIRNSSSIGLTGKWVLHNELRGGMMKQQAFMRECEEPLRELLDTQFQATDAGLRRQGAEHQEGFATPYAWLIRAFPQLPILLLYWPKDTEFDSKVTICFDSTADQYFDVEQLIFLVEEMVREIESNLD